MKDMPRSLSCLSHPGLCKSSPSSTAVFRLMPVEDRIQQNRNFPAKMRSPLNIKIHSLPDTIHLIDKVVDQFVEWLAAYQGKTSCHEAGSETKPITIGLSGGRLVGSLFSVLSTRLNRELSNRSELREVLDRCHFFGADERAVAPDHPESNYRLALECLFEATGIKSSNIHRIHGEIGMEKAASQAEAEYRSLFSSTNNEGMIPPMDLVFLGMGEDGHFASIFPGNTEIGGALRHECFYPVIGPKPPPERVTMSLRALLAARHVWVVISGEQKRVTLEAALREDSQLPIATLIQRRPLTTCYLDFPVTH